MQAVVSVTAHPERARGPRLPAQGSRRYRPQPRWGDQRGRGARHRGGRQRGEPAPGRPQLAGTRRVHAGAHRLRRPAGRAGNRSGRSRPGAPAGLGDHRCADRVERLGRSRGRSRDRGRSPTGLRRRRADLAGGRPDGGYLRGHGPRRLLCRARAALGNDDPHRLVGELVDRVPRRRPRQVQLRGRPFPGRSGIRELRRNPGIVHGGRGTGRFLRAHPRCGDGVLHFDRRQHRQPDRAPDDRDVVRVLPGRAVVGSTQPAAADVGARRSGDQFDGRTLRDVPDLHRRFGHAQPAWLHLDRGTRGDRRLDVHRYRGVEVGRPAGRRRVPAAFLPLDLCAVPVRRRGRRCRAVLAVGLLDAAGAGPRRPRPEQCRARGPGPGVLPDGSDLESVRGGRVDVDLRAADLRGCGLSVAASRRPGRLDGDRRNRTITC